MGNKVTFLILKRGAIQVRLAWIAPLTTILADQPRTGVGHWLARMGKVAGVVGVKSVGCRMLPVTPTAQNFNTLAAPALSAAHGELNKDLTQILHLCS